MGEHFELLVNFLSLKELANNALAEGQRPQVDLEVSPRSGLYLLVANIEMLKTIHVKYFKVKMEPFKKYVLPENTSALLV